MLRPSKSLLVCLGALVVAFSVALLTVKRIDPEPPSEEGQPLQARVVETRPRLEEYALNLRLPREGNLDGQEKDRYGFSLEAGQFFHAAVDQNAFPEFEVDLEIDLYGPGDPKLYTIDTANGTNGPEEIFLYAKVAGRYHFEVGSSKSGRYRIRPQALRTATDTDMARARADELFHQSRWLAGEGEREQAVAGFSEAVRLWKALGERDRQADAYRRLGTLYGDSRPAKALDAWLKALSLYRAVGNSFLEVSTLNEIGTTYERLGKVRLTEEYYELALRRSRETGYIAGQAAAQKNLCDLMRRQGRFARALKLCQAAIAIWRGGAPKQEAMALMSLGRVYLALGEHPLAIEQYEKAEKLVDEAGDDQFKARLLTQYAELYGDMGDLEKALPEARRALRLRREGGDIRGEGVTLVALALLLRQEKSLRQARLMFQDARRIFQETEDPSSEAATYINLGLIYLEEQQADLAVAHFERGLDLSMRQELRDAEAIALYGIAKAEQLRGNRGRAISSVQDSIAAVEAMRQAVFDDNLKASFLETKQNVYELLIELLMDGAMPQDRRRDAIRAFETSERRRSRSLLESLAPGHAREDAPAPVTLGQAQRLLDEETTLLEFSLGQERSFVWLVTSSSFEVVPLPGRDEINASALALWDRLAGRGALKKPGKIYDVARDLAELVLRPISGRLRSQRLVVVPDGGLHYIPFALLLDVDKATALNALGVGQVPRLVEDHQIITLPSASVLGAIRELKARRARPAGLLAVLANPVFLPGGYPALPRTQEEAEAILRLIPPGEETFKAFGRDATRDLALSDQLAEFRILHIATHGWADTEDPARSGILLTEVDSSGRKLEGRLLAYDIQQMDLAADLVVLSACRTALGKEVRGEGLIGLTHSFMHAGAASVVVSLWDVHERSTPYFMERFYKALLKENRSPPEALRQAQLAMIRHPKWNHPYYWAGFVVQGDWK